MSLMLACSQSSVTFLKEAPPDLSDDADDALGFGGGTNLGTTWSVDKITLDPNGLPTNLAELDASWTPEWANLVSYWKLNNSEVDSKGNNSGSAMGSLSYSTASKMGSHSAVLNGTDAAISIPDSLSLEITSQLTVSAWVKFASPSSNFYYRVVSKKSTYTDVGGYELTFNPGSRYLDINGGNGIYCRSNSAAMATVDTSWHYIVGTVNGNVGKVYLDGVDVSGSSPCTVGSLATNSVPLAIGNFGNTDLAYFDGSIDDVAVWNTALTGTEVAAIYARQSAIYAGQFTSRVMDGQGVDSWSALKWLTTLPFGKELPDNAASEVLNDYPSETSSLMNGNLALWHFNETAPGTVSGADFKDSSGNNFNLTGIGSMGFGTSGKFNHGITFDGSTSAINFAGGFDPWANDFTMSLWASVGSSNSQTVLMTGGSWTVNGFRFGLWNLGWLFWTAQSGGSIVAYAPAGVSMNQWNHVVVTFTKGVGSTGTFTTYLNGVPGAPSTGTYIPFGGEIFPAGVHLSSMDLWTSLRFGVELFLRARFSSFTDVVRTASSFKLVVVRLVIALTTPRG